MNSEGGEMTTISPPSFSYRVSDGIRSRANKPKKKAADGKHPAAFFFV
jgi:hypothetical protein